jgi:acetyl-CoA carboxylase biotin carboxyl carrier protein
MKDSDSSSTKEVPEKMIRKLSELLKSTDLAEIEWSFDNMSLRVRAKESSFSSHLVSAPSMLMASSSSSAPAPKEAAADLHIVRSPFIGTFYRSPSPSAAAFAEEGQNVSKGQVLCIVEAMKIMNEIECDSSGKIEKIFVENGTPVDFNTPLFGLRK